MGYEEGRNLNAASYDWRLPPSELERRDQYFTKTTKMVEEMYEKNKQTPVVIVCHSLGCRVGHYWLNFALERKGRAWIDKHVHTYMPVGAPHLGASKSIRAQITGDQMGLPETFLAKEEALAFGRSLGSGPWMFPRDLPAGAPSCTYYKPSGTLEVTAKGSPIEIWSMLEGRRAIAYTNNFKLALTYAGKTVITDWHEAKTQQGKRGPKVVHFPEKFVFATEPNAVKVKVGNGSDYLQVLLLEPGTAAAKKGKRKESCLLWVFCCPCMLICLPFRLLCCIVSEMVILSAESVSRASGGSTIIAASYEMKVSDILKPGGSPAKRTFPVALHLRNKVAKKQWCLSPRAEPQTVNFALEWTPHQPSAARPRIAAKPAGTKDLVIAGNGGHRSCDSQHMLKREGVERCLQMMQTVYEKDPFDPRGTEAPPIHTIKAIYGINLPTEVGTVYVRRAGNIVRLGRSAFKVDKKACLSKADAKNGYTISDGIIQETKKTRQVSKQCVSGDGTVPYYSLSHVKTWGSDTCKVDITELPGAEHRKILNDKRFHKLVIDYVCVGTTNSPRDVTNIDGSLPGWSAVVH